MTLLGANATLSPNTDTRVAESVVTGGLGVTAGNRTVVVQGFQFKGPGSPLDYSGTSLTGGAADLTFQRTSSPVRRRFSVQLALASNTATVLLDDNTSPAGRGRPSCSPRQPPAA